VTLFIVSGIGAFCGFILEIRHQYDHAASSWAGATFFLVLAFEFQRRAGK
jgi:hypothetical protein